MRSALPVTLLIFCLPVLIGQSPQDLAKELRSTDWKIRNSAVLAIEKLPPAQLPVDDLISVLNAKDLPIGAQPTSSVGGAFGGRRGGAAAARRKPAVLNAWTVDTRLREPGIDLDAPPMKHPRLLAPFGSNALAAFLLRRSTRPEVLDALESNLSTTDESLGRQCALSLAALGDPGRKRLELFVRGGEGPWWALEGMLHTKGAARSVPSLLSAVPVSHQHRIEHILPKDGSAIAAAIGRQSFATEDRYLLAQSLRFVLHYDKDAVTFVRQQLQSGNETRTKHGLALAYALGARAIPLRDHVSDLVKSESPIIAQWAMSCLANMGLKGADHDRAVLVIASQLDPRGNEDTRYVALTALGQLSKLPAATLEVLRRLAQDGTDWDREAALRALANHDALKLMGPDLEQALLAQLQDPEAVSWLAIGLEHLSELVAIAHFKQHKPAHSSALHSKIRELPPARLQNLASRVTPWFDKAGTWLRRVIQLIDLVAGYEHGRGIPAGFLDPTAHSRFELQTRLDLLVYGKCLLAKDAPKFLDAVVACKHEEHWRYFFSHFDSDAGYMRAAVKAADEHASIRERVRATPWAFLRVKLDEATVLPLLNHQDPDLSEIGRRLIVSMDPFHTRAVSPLLTELKSKDSLVMLYILDTLRDAACPAVLPPEILSAIEDLLSNPDHAQVAKELLLRWSQ